MGVKKKTKTKTGWRRSFLPHETEKEGFTPGKGVRILTMLWLASGKLGYLNRPRSVANPTHTPPVLRGRKRGRDGPEGRQLRRELKGPKTVLLLPDPPGATRCWQGRGGPSGLWAESPLCHPSPLPPRAPHPGSSTGQIFSFFLFCFVSVPVGQNPLPGRQRPLSSRRSRRGPASSPCCG